jgi:hypothetical protein
MDAACFVTPFENSKNIVSSEGSYLGMLESSGVHKFGNGTSGRSTTHSNDAASKLTRPYLCLEQTGSLGASTVRRVLTSDNALPQVCVSPGRCVD